MAKKTIYITHPDLMHDYEGEDVSAETKTETAGYRTVTQQLAGMARAGLVNKLTRAIGKYDVESEVDEDVFMSGHYLPETYDAVSAEEALRIVSQRREQVRQTLERERGVPEEQEAVKEPLEAASGQGEPPEESED